MKVLGCSGQRRVFLSWKQETETIYASKVLVSPRKRLGKNDLYLFCFTCGVSLPSEMSTAKQ